MNQMLQEHLLGEFEIAVEGLRDRSLPPPARLYAMSASFGALNRVINLEYSRRLVFVHAVVQGAYNQINGLFAHGASPAAFRFDFTVFDRLADALEDLGNAIADENQIEPILEEIAELGYMATGNGNYLHKKGLPRLRSLDEN